MNISTMKFVILWLIGAFIYFFSVKNTELSLEGIIVPLSFCFLAILFIRAFSERYKTLFSYLLFFSTGILTFNGSKTAGLVLSGIQSLPRGLEL